MVDLLRTNDVVFLSFVQALLRDARIESVIVDDGVSTLYGGIGILPKRLMVLREDNDEALAILREAELINPDGSPNYAKAGLWMPAHGPA
ncbi:MAG: DUF2007 domain-containing protein [Alphaproteobacteria bacterium]